MFDLKEFKVELLRKGLTGETLAPLLGMKPSTLYRKMSGETEFTRPEMMAIRTFFKLSNERFIKIFFADEIVEA